MIRLGLFALLVALATWCLGGCGTFRECTCRHGTQGVPAFLPERPVIEASSIEEEEEPRLHVASEDWWHCPGYRHGVRVGSDWTCIEEAR